MIEGEQYQFRRDRTSTLFEFESVGPKGVITKGARFVYMDGEDDMYNFGFGDLDKETLEIDDTRMTRNGDSMKILRTVGNIINHFTLLRWSASIHIRGNTTAKHRWYRMNINKYHAQLDNMFDLWGKRDGKWVPYEVGKDYEAFLGRRKTPFLF